MPLWGTTKHENESIFVLNLKNYQLLFCHLAIPMPSQPEPWKSEMQILLFDFIAFLNFESSLLNLPAFNNRKIVNLLYDFDALMV
jgi:hypothetical protein